MSDDTEFLIYFCSQLFGLVLLIFFRENKSLNRRDLPLFLFLLVLGGLFSRMMGN